MKSKQCKPPKRTYAVCYEDGRVYHNGSRMTRRDRANARARGLRFAEWTYVRVDEGKDGPR